MSKDLVFEVFVSFLNLQKNVNGGMKLAHVFVQGF